jgi:hypothetical protein
MKKLRLLAWLITLTMLCELLPFSAFAQSDIAQTLVQRRVSTFSLDEQNDLRSVTFEGGTGTPENPYQIATAEQLDAMRNDLHASYVLVNDIDLSSYGSWIPIGWTSDPNIYYYYFYGNFDGQNHTIYNLTINYDDFSSFPVDSAPRNLGLFYSFAKYTDPDSDEEIVSGTIKNLNLTDINIYGQLPPNKFSIGGLAGSSVSAANISNCNVSGSINVRCSASATSDYGGTYQIGGLCGSSDYTTVSDCSSSVSITISDSCPNTVSVNCGGIIGWADRFTSFVNCVNYGAMTIPDTYATALSVGGIAAFVEGSIEKCINYGSFYVKNSVYHYSKDSNGYHIGGICGTARSRYSGPVFFDRFTIIDCVNCGSINGETSISGSAAGIFATANCNWDNYDNYINNCFNLASEINFSYTIAGETSYFAHRIASCTDIPRNVYSLNTTLLNGQIPLEPDSYLDGTSLSYTEIVSKIREIFPEFDWKSDSDTPGPEPSKEFTFKRDNLSFLNSGDDFFYGNSWDFKHPFQSYYEWLTGPSGNYNISSEAFERLTSPYVPRVVNYLKEKALAEWDGSCSGMSTVVALHYVAPERFPLNSVDASASNVYDLKAPKDDSSVEDLINYYQLLQLTPTMHKLKCDRFYFTAMHFEDSLNEVITELQSGYPVVIGLARNNKFSHGTHAVVLLSLIDDKETSNYYIARVYDPNKRSKSTMKIYKAPYDSKENSGIKISYGRYHLLYRYILTHTDLKYLDIHNFFGLDNNETAKDFDKAFIKSDGSIKATYGKYFVRTENGELVECSSNVTVFKDENTLAEYVDSDDEPDICDFDITFDDIPFASLELHLDSSGVNNASVLLKDTLLSISTTGPADLVYNETARTLDITAENPTDVSLLFTQNGVSTNWPWHSWVIDTTGATEFHASMDDDGLHLSGDGITNAKYATENADTENVDSGTISVQPDADGITTVTITNKKSSSGDSLEIVTPSAPTTGNAITIMNGFAYIDDPEQPVNSAALGDVVTIVANDRSSEGKTFTGWVVNSGDVTLNDSSASPTSFTMGDKAVSITAQYSTNSTPTPTPGGGSSSGGGGGGGGGAAVLIGVGAAAAITAGVIMMSPVEIKGRVVLADQAAVPGAKISLLREGKVVAQTTADENGSFALKAKRGSYELTAAYTTADGQLIYKTIDIKAPAKDLTVTF